MFFQKKVRYLPLDLNEGLVIKEKRGALGDYPGMIVGGLRSYLTYRRCSDAQVIDFRINYIVSIFKNKEIYI